MGRPRTAQAGWDPFGDAGMQTRRDLLRNPCWVSSLERVGSLFPFILSILQSPPSPKNWSSVSPALLSTSFCDILARCCSAKLFNTRAVVAVSVVPGNVGNFPVTLPPPCSPFLPCRKAGWRNPAPPRAASRAGQKRSQRVKGRTPTLPKKPKPR